jgi:hypothetical protein
MNLDKDAFSSGQIGSKIWLATELEKCIKDKNIDHPLNVAIIGGWYGVLNLILQSRNNLNINLVRTIDIDNDACKNADLVNEYWVWQNWNFKSICADANQVPYFDYNLVINCAVEHIPTLDWWDNIPENTLVVLQSNNMDHDDHVFNHHSLEEFSNEFQLTDTFFLGEKEFNYTDWSFIRFMKIGIK